ncbi:dTDP-4-dehydrorhamnose 3,5-epimerase [Candidatus Woesearchaeota archaeon CG10_big_fil_rev_8_21_14_0_10_44_13]|nr:MAG: dTDP-4-dehydrorhamnose 3,5-epimerase [Candidatus Woesearchaeota archaeon CG10_big_fil_rev_8_21_14_0_10_44_13]
MADKQDKESPIKGVVIRKLARFEDSRGWLSEIYRKDEDKGIKPSMCYISHTNFNAVRGPHEHKKQTDFFVFTGPGDFELYLWDNRKNSVTFGRSMRITAGESNKVSVIVPPGVVHGYKSISRNGSFSINLPDRLYKGEGRKEEIDEIRHEDDPDPRFMIR